MMCSATSKIAADEPLGERFARRYGGLLITASILVAYANSFNVPFVFDGLGYIQAVEEVRHIWPPDRLLQLLTKGQTRALAYLTFGIDYQLYGFEVRGWHVTSTLIHLAAALTLYGIARHGFRSWRAEPYFGRVTERLSFVVALVWGVHPLQTQSVTYLYQRQESLMGLCYLLTLFALTRYATTERIRWAFLSLAACAAGMTAKEVMVTAPLVVLWYDRVFCVRAWGEIARRRGAYYGALAATWGVLVWLMTRTWGAYDSAGILRVDEITPLEYAFSQLVVIARYLRLSFLPWGLNIDYGWTKAAVWPLPDADGIHWFPTAVNWAEVALPAVIVGVSLLFTVIAVFRSPAPGFLAGAFFLILAPTSSIAPIIDLCFEHRMYLSLAPLTALATIGAWKGLQLAAARRGWSSAFIDRVAKLSVAAALIVLVALTQLRNHDYRSSVALWLDVTQKSPHYGRAFGNLAGAYVGEGDLAKAFEAATRAVQLDDNLPRAHVACGSIALHHGDRETAIRHLSRAHELEPKNVMTSVNLGVALNTSDPTRSRQLYLEALENDPKCVEAMANLANLCAARGELQEAKMLYERALALTPDNPQLRDVYSRHVRRMRPEATQSR